MSKYLQLDHTKGQFFEYSAKEKEGFKEHKNSKGDVSYRYYYWEGVKGVLESVSIYVGKFGKQISMTIKDENGSYMYLPIDIKDQRGNVSNYAESLTRLLPSLKKGMNVVVRGYNFIPEGTKYSKVGISIVADDVKLQGLSHSFQKADGELVKGDIPPIVWEDDLLDENKKIINPESLAAKNKYLLSVIKRETDRLKFVKGESNTETKSETPNNSNKTTPSTKKETTTVPPKKEMPVVGEEDVDFGDDDDDNLPF